LSLDNETLYDPRISLDGGELGLDYYIKIIDYLINVKFKGSLYFEIDPIISENMYKYLLEKGIKIVYKKVDYLSLDRLMKITLPSTN
jgi:methylase of polypeptide subunit release factors